MDREVNSSIAPLSSSITISLAIFFAVSLLLFLASPNNTLGINVTMCYYVI